VTTIPRPISYTLRVGVTGHRDLPDRAGVERAVAALLHHIQTTLESAAEQPRGRCGPHRTFLQRLDAALTRCARLIWWTLPLGRRQVPADRRTPIEWVVISPLARGADRIVAREILTRPGARLQVIAPLPLDDYRTDFATPEDRAEFEALLCKDPSPTLPDDADGDRGEHYLRAGYTVADACEILVAIWDGRPAAGRGGTADVVKYAADQGRVVLWIDANHPDNPPRQIVAAGADAATKPAGHGNGLAYRRMPATADRLSRNFHRLAAYNRDAAFSASTCESILNREAGDIRAAAARAGVPERVLAPALTHLLPEYARADQLAQRYQALYVRAATLVHGMAALAVTIVVAQVLFFPRDAWLVVFEIAAMTLAVLVLRVSWHEAWHEKWLRDRHLAERLRIAMFSTLMPQGVSRPAVTPEHVLPFYRGPETWVLEACDRILRSTMIAARSTAPVESQESPGAVEPPMEAMKRFIIDAWIEAQAGWHAETSARKRKAAEHVNIGGLVLFSTTLAMALWHWAGSGHGEDGNWLAVVATALAITLPAWAAALHAINTLLERERIAARSAQMAAVLHRLAQQAEHAATWQDLTACVSRAEEIMATENHEWWVSLSFRDLGLPG
jgi:hypothetical protein